MRVVNLSAISYPCRGYFYLGRLVKTEATFMEAIPSVFCNQIGNTPLVNLSDLVRPRGARLFGKCEFLNPGMSLKDRIAENMIRCAVERGELMVGGTIVCASSGNTGCSIAMLGSVQGFKVIVVTSEKCSSEKLKHIQAYHAELVVVKDSEYMQVASRLARENNYFDINQYSNPENPQAYYKTLGPELWRQTNGQITHFVMTGSTFGCISGTGKYLKEQNHSIQVVLADPIGSNMHKYYFQAYKTKNFSLEFGTMDSFIIEGAGKSKPTDCLNFNVIDDVQKVADQDSINMCHRLARHCGLLVGGSSGLNVHASLQLANKLTSNQTVVTILCDNGVKYLSKIYNSEFLLNNGITMNN